MDGILREFLTESHEHLAQFEVDLVALERSPEDTQLLARAYRALHTIKGNCGFLGLPRLGALAHAAESVLSRLRDGEILCTADRATVLLRVVDAIRSQLDTIENSGTEDAGDDAPLIAELLDRQAPAPRAPLTSTPQATDPSTTSRTVRIDLDLLDSLHSLVGELVLMRNRVVRSSLDGSAVNRRRGERRELDRLTTQLQDTVMRVRMEPIGRLFERMARPVRDLAAQLGREVEFASRGGETELDRTLVETIADPLLHLVRNAVDHGVESPEERIREGKPAAATVTLSAHQAGSQIVLEVRDDGRGIDREALRRKAKQQALPHADDAGYDPLDFIFEPGLSTADAVSSISGRGVGMDVVRTNVERLGGAIEIESVPGVGTTIRVRLPLTLAILPGVVVACGNQQFVLPQRHLREMLRLRSRESLDYVHDAPVYRLHGRLLPIVLLENELGLKVAENEGAALAVMEAGGRRFGLVVDRIVDTQEIVVKPLGDPLGGLGIYGGATTLGDGHVVLILEPGALAAAAGVRVEPLRDDGPSEPEAIEASERFLMVDALDGCRILLPLNRISRLEEVDATQVQNAAGRACIPYRGDVLPLLIDGEPGERTWLAVLSGDQGPFGMLVAGVRDVIDAEPTETTIVDGRVAECFDVRAAEQRLLRRNEEALR